MDLIIVFEIYIIWGIGWGLLCLSIAKDKEKNPKLWLVLGILFNVITFIILMNLPRGNEIMEKTYSCPFCKHNIRRRDKYCSECGEVLKGVKTENFSNKFCSHCGKGIKKEYKFCTNCGRLLIPLKSFNLKMTDNGIHISNLS